MGFSDSYELVSWERSTSFGSSQRTDAIIIGAGVPVGVAVTTNNLAATSLTFEVAKGSTHTFYAVVTSSGGSVAVNTSTQAAQYYPLDSKYFYGANALKVVASSTAGADTDKPITLITRPLV